MKTVTWTNDSGELKVVALFVKGTGAESVRSFETEADAKAAIKWLNAFCGKDYANNDFPWAVKDAKNGKPRQLFTRFVQAATDSPF
jgi:hypothetical protein